jgi:hypothetical protein
VRNKVGEALYQTIAPTHGALAGKLTGMFLEATEVCVLDVLRIVFIAIRVYLMSSCDRGALSLPSPFSSSFALPAANTHPPTHARSINSHTEAIDPSRLGAPP